MAVWQNYSRGDPSPVLYVKNLVKGVTEDNLLYIFGEDATEAKKKTENKIETGKKYPKKKEVENESEYEGGGGNKGRETGWGGRRERERE